MFLVLLQLFLCEWLDTFHTVVVLFHVPHFTTLSGYSVPQMRIFHQKHTYHFPLKVASSPIAHSYLFSLFLSLPKSEIHLLYFPSFLPKMSIFFHVSFHILNGCQQVLWMVSLSSSPSFSAFYYNRISSLDARKYSEDMLTYASQTSEVDFTLDPQLSV